jgi:hypothetical protein
MRPLALAVAVLSSSLAPAATQEAVDTMVAVQGFLQQDDQVGTWTIVVPLPLEVLGTRTFVLPLVGKPERWSRYVNRYIEARGRITRLPERGHPGIGMEIDKAQEIEPPGTVRTTVDHGVTLHADVTLSAIPNRFRWRDANGNETGVNPLLLYVILNRRDSPILFILPTKDLLCVSVKSVKDDVILWDSTTHAVSPDARRFAVQRAGRFRDAIHLPEAAASRPGRYRASVGICAVDDYDIAVEFEVQ